MARGTSARRQALERISQLVHKNWERNRDVPIEEIEQEVSSAFEEARRRPHSADPDNH